MKPVERGFVRSLYRFSYKSAIARYYPYALQDLPKHLFIEKCLPPGAKIVSAKAFRAAIAYCVRLGTFSMTSDEERRMFLGELQAIHSTCEKNRFDEDFDYEESHVPVGTIVQHNQFGYRGIVMGQSKSKGIQLLVDERQLESMGTRQYDTNAGMYSPIEGEESARIHTDKLHTYFSNYSTVLKRYLVHEPLRAKLRADYTPEELEAARTFPEKIVQLCDNLVGTKRDLLADIEDQLRKFGIDVASLIVSHNSTPDSIYFDILRHYLEAHKKLQLACAAYNNSVPMEDVLSVIPAEHWTSPAISPPANIATIYNTTANIILRRSSESNAVFVFRLLQ